MLSDKNELHQGMVGQYKNSMGVVRAPNFPHGYALNGETFTYMIQNLDPYGHVRFMAIDWDIASESEVKVSAQVVWCHNECTGSRVMSE